MRSGALMGNPNQRCLMLGNEAIARGAIEAGVGVVTGYPGTPSSEIIDSLASVAKNYEIYVEWSVNEKVAFEIALGAALSGIRAMATMKAPGLNVALDPIMSAAYSGVFGGLVILVADDPGPHTTQTEQDNRIIGELSLLPILEPSDPQEAKDIIKKAFEISEELEIPVIVRTTTRLNHTSANVTLGEVVEIQREPWFKKEPERFIRASMAWNLQRHKWLNEQLEKAQEIMEDLEFNRMVIKKDSEFGIITSGVSYTYVREIIEKYNLKDINILKIAAINPLPRKLIQKFLRNVSKVLIVEELEPYIERNVKEILYDMGKWIKILGKYDKTLPREGEFNPRIVLKAIEKLIRVKLSNNSSSDRSKIISEAKRILPSRAPPMCPGCPHMGTYLALRRALRKLKLTGEKAAVFGDIGCYALSFEPPHRAIWTEHAMGSSIGMAAGLYFSGSKQKSIATIGDSTFFHMGIQPLIDAVQHGANITIIVADNEIIAMTGHQPHPGSGFTVMGQKTRRILIEDIAKAAGVKFVRVVDPYNLEETEKAITEALQYEGVSVVIARRACAIYAGRLGLAKEPYYVDQEKCTGCRVCLTETGCFALIWENGKVKIDPYLCFGCSLCQQICPFNAILR